MAFPTSDRIPAALAWCGTLLACLATTARAADEPWEKLFKKAQAVRAEDGPLASLTFFEQAIKMQSDQAPMYFARAQVHHELGGNEKALRDYNTAIMLDPDNAEYYFHRGRFWFEMKSPEDADRDLQQALRLQPGYPDAVFFLIQHKLLEGKQYQKAIDACDLVLSKHPEEQRAYYLRGMIRFRLKHYVNAEYDFGMAISLDREYASAYRYRGLARLRQGNVQAALSDFDAAVELKPSYHQVYHERAEIWYRAEQLERAQRDINLAVKYCGSPTEIPIDYLLLRGRVAHALGDPHSAKRDFYEVLDRDPSAADRVPNAYRR